MEMGHTILSMFFFWVELKDREEGGMVGLLGRTMGEAAKNTGRGMGGGLVVSWLSKYAETLVDPVRAHPLDALTPISTTCKTIDEGRGISDISAPLLLYLLPFPSPSPEAALISASRRRPPTYDLKSRVGPPTCVRSF